MKHLRSAMIIAVAAIGSHTASAQDEVTLLEPGSIRAAIEQLLPGFESQTGHKVKATLGLPLGTKEQLTRGEAYDVPIIQMLYPEVLAPGVVVGSTKTIANVFVGLAVPQGASKPDISTPEAVKKMLLAAKSIAYPTTPPGVSFEETLKKLGIADQMQPKIKRTPNTAGMTKLVANGEADLGFAFLSEMVGPGIEVVGPLPKEISNPATLVGFVSAHAKDPAAATALLDYLASPQAASAYQAHRMQPAP